MQCKDIIKIIEQDYSPRYALSWDNVGLLAGKNDLKLLEETKVGRNINRHYYTKED